MAAVAFLHFHTSPHNGLWTIYGGIRRMGCFYDAVGKDNLRFNLDTANQFVMKDNLALSLRRLAGLIDYIHISDNGGKVEHLPIGNGAIHLDSFFSTLEEINYNGFIGLDIGGEESKCEIRDACIHSAEYLEKRLRYLKTKQQIH